MAIQFRRLDLLGNKLLLILLAFVLQSSVIIHDCHSETLTSSLAGLSLEQAYVGLITDNKVYPKLLERVRERFRDAGMNVHIGEAGSSEQKQLLIGLWTRPLNIETGANLVSYTRKIELYELVQLDRKDKRRVQAITWSSGLPDKIRQAKPVEEELLQDLDQMLSGFISDYKYSNHSRDSQ